MLFMCHFLNGKASLLKSNQVGLFRIHLLSRTYFFLKGLHRRNHDKNDETLTP